MEGSSPDSLLWRELHAQPETLTRFLDREGARTRALGARLAASEPAGVLIAARGSSDHAAVYAKYLFGARLGWPVALAAPSLVTAYHRPPRLDGWIAVGISQSGASPDVVAVIRAAREAGRPTVAITDRADSDLARAAEHVVGLCVDGEHSVAATGSFTNTLLAIAHFAVGASEAARGASVAHDVAELAAVPERARAALDADSGALAVAERLAEADWVKVIGRGFGFPVALEWALKMKETAGLPSDPYSAADFRHGPIALASPSVPVLAIDIAGPTHDDITALLAELDARGVRAVRAADDPGADLVFPSGPEWLAPIPAAIVGQLVAFRAAQARGQDPDQPIGITKVTRTF